MKSTMCAVLAMLISLSSSIQPASAEDITRFLRNYLGLSGGVHTGFAPDQARIQSNINSHLAHISSEISSGITSGKLTADEAAALNAELNRVTSMHNTCMADGGYTNLEVQQILSAFTGINNQVATCLHNSDIASSTAFGVVMPRNWQSVTTLQANIRQKIRDGLDEGTLTSAEARMLRSEYYQISRRLTRRQMWGNPNINPLVRQLVNLERRVDQLTEEREFAGRDYRWF